MTDIISLDYTTAPPLTQPESTPILRPSYYSVSEEADLSVTSSPRRRRESRVPNSRTAADLFGLGRGGGELPGGPRAGADSGTSGVEGVYIISVAARILEMHPQTLRKYERAGLVMPSRTVGMLRLYSEEDIARLKLIKHLVGDLGLNLAGVQLMLQLFNRMLEIRARLPHVPEEKLGRFVDMSIDELFELIHAHEARES